MHSAPRVVSSKLRRQPALTESDEEGFPSGLRVEKREGGGGEGERRLSASWLSASSKQPSIFSSWRQDGARPEEAAKAHPGVGSLLRLASKYRVASFQFKLFVLQASSACPVKGVGA